MKKFITTIVFFAALPLCAEQIPFINLDSTTGTKPAPAPTATTCEDFTGDWKGDCVDAAGKKYSGIEVKLAQTGCDKLSSTSNGKTSTTDIGSFDTAKDSNKTHAYAAISIADWNDTKTELGVSSYFAYKAIGTNKHAFANSTSNVKKDGKDKLLLTTKYSAGEMKCEFTK
jgi:hypothetical protein